MPTLQDRWVKELRLAQVTTIEQANTLLDTHLLGQFNRRFTVPPASPNDAHRPLGRSTNLDAILSIQAQRTVANDYTVRFENVVYQLLPPAWPGLRGGRVLVEQRADGSLKFRFRQRYLPFEAFRRIPANESPTAALGALPPKPPGVYRMRVYRQMAKAAPPNAGRGLLPYRPPPNAQVALLRCPILPTAPRILTRINPGVHPPIIPGEKRTEPTGHFYRAEHADISIGV